MAVLPLTSPYPIEERIPERSREALRKFSAALEEGVIRTKHLEIKDGLELAYCDRFGLPFKTVLCKHSGLIYTTPQLSEEDLPDYYERFYHQLHFGRPVAELKGLYQDGERQGRRIWNHIKPHLPSEKHPLSIIEVGCGVGNVLAGVEKNARVDGVDICSTGVEYSSDCLKAAVSRGINVVHGGFEEAAELDRQFDVVLLSHIFEHVTDMDATLLCIRPILKPRGLLYIEVPGIFSIHRRMFYKFDWVSYVTHAHIHHFCLSSLNNVLRRSGFELLTGNEVVEAVYRIGTATSQQRALVDTSDLVVFTEGYLAMLSSEQDWFITSVDSPMQALNRLSKQLDTARERIRYYDSSRDSFWWIFKQLVRKIFPWLEGVQRRIRQR